MEHDIVFIGSWLDGLHKEDMEYFKAEDFEERNRELFMYAQEGVEIVEIPNRSQGRYSHSDIVEILKESPTDSINESMYQSALRYELKLKGTKAIRNLANNDKMSFEKKCDGIRKIIDKVQSLDMTEEADTGLANKYVELLDARRTAKYVRYGLPNLDRVTGGIKRKELTIVAARTGVGKTSFAIHLLDRFITHEEKVLFFPLEMDIESITERLILHQGLCDTYTLRSGKIPDNVKARIVEYIEHIEKCGKFRSYESKKDIETIEALIMKEHPYAVIIDQLTQLSSKKRSFKSDLEHHQFMSANLKRIAMTYNVAVILLHQINRTNEDEAKLSGLKGSGSLEEDADNVILLQRASENEIAEYEKYSGARLRKGEEAIYLKLAKHRSGETIGYIVRRTTARFKYYEVTKEEQQCM